ncbi:MAG: STAS domain-containing protein [Phycisphaerales bacterium]|nr:MAG: STAS domain-containing protein [Phycisphaerales bacterium]
MWNPFAKKNKPDPAGSRALQAAQARAGASEGDGESSETARPGTTIAEIELIGSTAVATLTVTELTADGGAERLADLLFHLTESGAKHFVLDIQNVQYMDSACLGCLVESLNQMSSSGGRIALANTAHSVQYLFRLTRLDRVFPICKDVMAALETVERAA